MAAEHQDAGVQEDQTVSERGQGKAPARGDQDGDRDEDRRDLEDPGVPVFRPDAREEEKHESEDEENEGLEAPIQSSLSSCDGSSRTSVRS